MTRRLPRARAESAAAAAAHAWMIGPPGDARATGARFTRRVRSVTTPWSGGKITRGASTEARANLADLDKAGAGRYRF